MMIYQSIRVKMKYSRDIKLDALAITSGGRTTMLTKDKQIRFIK